MHRSHIGCCTRSTDTSRYSLGLAQGPSVKDVLPAKTRNWHVLCSTVPRVWQARRLWPNRGSSRCRKLIEWFGCSYFYTAPDKDFAIGQENHVIRKSHYWPVACKWPNRKVLFSWGLWDLHRFLCIDKIQFDCSEGWSRQCFPCLPLD